MPAGPEDVTTSNSLQYKGLHMLHKFTEPVAVDVEVSKGGGLSACHRVHFHYHTPFSCQPCHTWHSLQSEPSTSPMANLFTCTLQAHLTSRCWW